ncbi:FAD-binding and (Fe-S)-binding domain-containing protein [Devosia sp. MC1541]|uniref:FAD-binding and (Fe-S)-binding domain-containing protein n=1 Tax=Devosia sp. MC1541 TaxID=2725264 RepID=UPI00145E6B36|nr:FAD-binding and (Fe-S)-binding domain-containing protein [Devosia sp. MC1541]
MIPAVKSPDVMAVSYQNFLDHLRVAGFSGDLETGLGHRLVQSTDNSIYQIVPDAVAYPRSIADLQLIASRAREEQHRSIILRPRGGGTGTNGQSLGNGVIVDMSRHMNKILAIDPVRRVAIVQPGVVKDQLQKALKPYGLFFPPELSTSNRATIGGMISTDASGQGSVLYGKTRDHVRAVKLVLSDGSVLDTGAHGDLDLAQELDALERDVAERWLRDVPQLNRNVTGYDLGHLRKADGSLDLNSVICGSEGTLGLIAEAELALTPIPDHMGLVTIVYADFVSMLRETKKFLGFGAASVEVVDERVLGLARTDAAGEKVAHFFKPSADGRFGSACMVEFVADSADGLEQQMLRLVEAVKADGQYLSLATTNSRADIADIWAMRKRAVGILGNVTGTSAPVAFVEDTAVPPDQLADYIQEFRALLDRFGLGYGMFGHADSGVIHVRPDMDLYVPERREQVQAISDSVYALTQKYGGVLWGEHGKGVRGAYTRAFFGELYPAIQRVKALFDPHEQFNPGKIASNFGPLTDVGDVPMRGEREAGLARAHSDGYSRALKCNGNGACFDFEFDAPMCPSWKATRDRRQSPKGRATLVREWLRLVQAEEGTQSGTRSRSWRPRLFAWGSKGADFSHEVKAALDTCLGCKACKGTCPVKVDVPAFKSRFLEQYHTRYWRTPADRLIAEIELFLPLLPLVAPVYRLMANTKLGQSGLRLLGLEALPSLPKTLLKSDLAERGVGALSPPDIGALSPRERQDLVAIVPDAFVAIFEPALLLDLVDLLQGLGFRPFIVRVQNGKPLHAKGLLKRFDAVARRTAARLRAYDALGVPLIGVDPAMTLVYRDEYAPIVDGAVNVKTIEEFLSQNLHRLADARRDAGAMKARLANHCTATSNLSASSRQWGEVLAAAGIAAQTESLGCCGMAGTFGHEAKNRRLSQQIYGLSWRSRVEEPSLEAGELVATGLSCRCQAEKESDARLRHPVSLILEQLRARGA